MLFRRKNVRSSSLLSNYNIQQIPQLNHNRSQSHHKVKSNQKKTKDTIKQQILKKSKLLKTFDYANPLEQIEKLSSQISSMKLKNQILKVKVIDSNVRSKKQSFTKGVESFVTEQRQRNIIDLQKKLSVIDQKINDIMYKNNKQEEYIQELKIDIMGFKKQNSIMKRKIKMKENPSRTLQALLAKLRN